MHWQSFVRLTSFALALVVLLSARASAKPPWQLISFRRIEANPDKQYNLEEDHGPWLIYVSSFAGDGAKGEAQRLVMELRKKYKLQAYLHTKKFDFTERMNGIGINRDRTPKRMKYDKEGVVDEYAVLIGNFTSVDDPDLQKNLKRIKTAQPECLTGLKEGTTRRFAGLRAFHKRINGNEEKQRRGPMGNAFAVTNPMIPREYFAPKGIDKLVLKMNKNVEHSLLECKAKYTVRVATFRGNVVLDQKKVQEIEQGHEKMSSLLERAALKAHRLTTLLRKEGVEAYEFHDRHESYVTVGSFDWVGQPRADGRQEMNPAILRVIQRYGPKRQAVGNSSSGQSLAGLQPRTIKGIPFDVQPWPVEVPRRSIATDYARSR